MVKGGLIGALVSLAATILLSAGTALLISGEYLPQTAMGYCTLAVLLISSAIGALTAIKIGGGKPMIVSILSALIYFLVLLLLTAVFFGGDYAGVGVTAAVIASGAACTAILLAGFGQKTQKGKRKKKHR